jgi:hypothetical protein
MKLTDLSTVQRLDIAMRARYPVIWIVTSEEIRVESTVHSYLKSSKHSAKPVYTWTISRGIRQIGQPTERFGPEDPIQALEFVATFGVTEENRRGNEGVFIFKDLDPYMTDPRCARALRDTIADLTNSDRIMIAISPTANLPSEVKRQVAMLEWPLPNLEELKDLLDGFVQSLAGSVQTVLNGDRELIAKALQGLTETQAENVLATAVVATGRLDRQAVDFILTEKRRAISESGLLEIFEPLSDMPEIGGLDLLKGYLRDRRGGYSDKARQYGTPQPKGLLLVGVPGCGKSLASKTIAKEWNMLLVRMDIGALMGSLVGQSEANVRQALQVVESVAPCVLWLDEIEKGLSGIQSSGHTDGGTTSRVFGTLLTWMQEREKPVYMVATSNNIQALPPELLRAGRFDDVFFIDLPTATERRDIWSIHIRRVNRDIAVFNLDALVEVSQGYTGSEIEAAIGSALFAGFAEERDITTADLVAAIQERVPLTQTMSEEIGALRAWAKGRAKPASKPQEAAVAKSGRRLDLG